MAIKLIMPKLGLNMVEGQVTQWVKHEGDDIKKGETIFIVETDKVTNEVEAPENGRLVKILVEEGGVVPVRQTVGILAAEGEQVDIEALLRDEKPAVEKQLQPQAKTASPANFTQSAASSGQILASPLAKRLAADNKINLLDVKGSGPGGRINTEDVEKLIAQKGAGSALEALPGKLVPLAGMRKVIAERMTLSATSVPMVTLNSNLDITPLVSYRERLKNAGKDKQDIPGYNAIIAYLTAKTLQEFPYLNASFSDKGIRLIEAINIGVAVDTPEGLMVVVVKNAAGRDLAEINADLNTMIERALNHKSTPEDLSNGTFTITNLGMVGVDSFNPIINPPEAGILGIGKFSQADFSNPSDSDRKIFAVFSLTFDHRVIDGAPAARFLQRLGELIFSFK